MAKLTPKQQRFVEEYLVDLNATQAAVRAGYSEKGASVTGSQLLANPKVSQAIAEARKKLSEKTSLSAEYVDANLMQIVQNSMQRIKLLDDDGNQVLDEKGEPVWVLVNAKAALGGCEQMNKRLGLFKDKLELSGALDLGVLEEARRRAADGR